ncbi:dihydropyrimidinase [Candidatus Formimonas warabiya]|uniref:Dihydropyrimidinase n=1 Tax=Formimonas warabiya TaxID=1761012 RepID=A0A3G1KQ74_FORW1|nr:dihydropyrimidinase [Candidatus Formimonas warabiya]ATW24598.1 dihydropyrimidinase [Candidatus Formimonas warabiya]
MTNSVLIKNGIIADAQGVYRSDLLIEEGKIKQIGTELHAPGIACYDAENMFIFPGIVDPHVQLEIKYGKFPMTDDFDTGTVAAAAGGVTTIIDFADQPKGVHVHEDLAKRKALAEGRVNVDYSLHMSITDLTAGAIDDIQGVIGSGIPSFKLYMAYSRRDRMVNEGQINHVMEEVAKYGGITGIHGENDNFVEYMISRFQKEGKTGLAYFTQARPALGEIMAVQSAILLAEQNNCTLYVHHVTCAGTMEAIKAGRKRGVKIFAETCPVYLCFTEDEYLKPGGELFVLNPALRTRTDNEALWQAIISGDIDTIGTDHCSYTKAQKQENKNNFDGIPAGLPGIELLLPCMYTMAVAERKLPLPKLLQVMTSNPARIFGISPQKGHIIPGSDGDIVIFNPRKKWIVDPDKLCMQVDFTPFDGWEMHGAVETTFLRGMKIFDKGSFSGPRNQGKFVFGMPNAYYR